MPSKLKLVMVSIALILHSPHSLAERVLVAVASNFSVPMEQIASEFERLTTHELSLVFGSSGRLFAQIQNGAPFQIFFSADQQKPQQLESAGLTIPDSRFTYVRGSLVLWSANPSVIIDGVEILESDFNRLALANPTLAPYGLAATEVLEHLGMTAETIARWVQGENIAQTFQFVETQNADLGFVALSQVWKDGRLTQGTGFLIPQEWHNPIRQDAVRLKLALDCSACEEFVQFMRSDYVTDLLLSFGYAEVHN